MRAHLVQGMSLPRLFLVLFALVFLLPIAVAGALHLRDGIGEGWWAADRSSAGLLPPPHCDIVRALSDRRKEHRCAC